MRIYITGDSNELVIAAANMLNNGNQSGIVSEAKRNDYENLINEAAVRTKNYDIVMLFSRKPLEACADINKLEGTKAVVCENDDRAKRIHAVGKFNIVVIDSNSMSKRELSNIISTLTASKVTEQSSAADDEPEPAPRPQKKGTGIAAGLKSIAGRARPKHVEIEEEEYAHDANGPNFIDKAKKKGFMSALKDELGME